MLFSCKKNKSSSLVSELNYVFYPEPTCEEIERAPMHDAVLFFDIKGLVDENAYSKLPDEKLRKEMMKDSVIVSTLKNLFNYVVINGTCEYSKELMHIYKVTSLPTIIRTDKNGTASDRIVGLASMEAIKQKILLLY
jgi:hypothetical protein